MLKDKVKIDNESTCRMSMLTRLADCENIHEVSYEKNHLYVVRDLPRTFESYQKLCKTVGIELTLIETSKYEPAKYVGKKNTKKPASKITRSETTHSRFLEVC